MRISGKQSFHSGYCERTVFGKKYIGIQNKESDRRTASGSGREGNSMVHIAQLENIVYTGNWWE